MTSLYTHHKQGRKLVRKSSQPWLQILRIILYNPLQFDEYLASPAQKLPVTGRRTGCNFLLVINLQGKLKNNQGWTPNINIHSTHTLVWFCDNSYLTKLVLIFSLLNASKTLHSGNPISYHFTKIIFVTFQTLLKRYFFHFNFSQMS